MRALVPEREKASHVKGCSLPAPKKKHFLLDAFSDGVAVSASNRRISPPRSGPLLGGDVFAAATTSNA